MCAVDTEEVEHDTPDKPVGRIFPTMTETENDVSGQTFERKKRFTRAMGARQCVVSFSFTPESLDSC